PAIDPVLPLHARNRAAHRSGGPGADPGDDVGGRLFRRSARSARGFPAPPHRRTHPRFRPGARPRTPARPREAAEQRAVGPVGLLVFFYRHFISVVTGPTRSVETR